MTFNSQESDFLDAWDYQPRAFNIASSGGLTIVVIVCFMGTFQQGERIIDFGNAYDQNVRAIDKTWIGVITPNTWMRVVVRYNATTLEYVMRVNNALVCGGVASTALTDRTLRWTRVGRSLWGSDPYLNGDIAGLYVIDKFLSSAKPQI